MFMFSPLYVGWLVYQQNYTKNTELISMKLKDGSRPTIDPLTFGADLNKGMNPGLFSHFLSHCEIGHYYTFTLISVGIIMDLDEKDQVHLGGLYP